MKKLIILGAGLLLAAGAVVFAVANKPLTPEEALLRANVEAIAQTESGGGSGWDGPCGTQYTDYTVMHDCGGSQRIAGIGSIYECLNSGGGGQCSEGISITMVDCNGRVIDHYNDVRLSSCSSSGGGYI